MGLQISYIKNPIKKYTFLLLASSIFGVHLMSFDIGAFRLSIYRVLILVSPLLYFYVSSETKQKLRTAANYSYFRFLLVWVIYSIIGLFWVKDISGWLKNFSFLVCGCISSWFVGWYFFKKEDWVNALKIIEVFAFAFCIIGVYEMITGNYMFITRHALDYFENESSINSTIGIRIPVSVFQNPNNFALFLLCAIFGSMALCKVKKSQKGRLSSFLLLNLFVFLLIATQSRSGFIGFLIGLIPLTYLYLKRSSVKTRIVFIIIAFILLFSVSSVIIKNNELYRELIRIDTRSGSDLIRLNLIRNGLIFFLDSLFMGVGLGNIEYFMVNHPIYPTYEVTDIHNWWMEILVSSGIFIFVMYAVIYVKSLWKLLQMSLIKTDKVVSVISVCFFCFLLALIITSAGSSSCLISEWLWPIMAVVMSFVNITSKNNID